MNETWETIIGLEVHLQLNTKTKLFSPAPNRFGDEPNTNIHEVCTGQPGSLPVLNAGVVKKAIQLGCALGSTVNLYSKFDRKSYFYPDSPRNFQITQYDEPILTGGELHAELDGALKIFGIHHAQIEDDAGMLKHFSTFAGVDYNRAGAPLIEIVTEPCLKSAQEASSFIRALRSLAQYIDISDANMEAGQLRMDVNISVKKRDESQLRQRIEIKNLNSISAMEAAVASESERQVALYEANPDKNPFDIISGSTYRWDPELNETVLMRRKEDAQDYRYFPEPDLPPILLKESEIEEIRKNLPELPLAKKKRYLEELKLNEYHTEILTADVKLCQYFEEALETCSDARAVCNWITVEFFGRLKDSGKTLESIGLPPAHIGELVHLINSGTITGKIAKSVADDMCDHPQLSPKAIIEQNPDYQVLGDESAIDAYVEQVIQEQSQSVTDFLEGRDKAFGFLVGQVMKLCQGKADPKLVNELLRKKLGALKG